MKQLRYSLEIIGLYFVVGIFRLLPLDAASATGGWLGRTIGPRLAASRKARRNLENALPELSAQETDRIVTGMWDNLGRVIAEYPHLEQIGKERVSFETAETAAQFLAEDRPCIMLAGHFANWESAAVGMRFVQGKEVDVTYRPPNNPGTDRLLMKARTLNGRIRAYPKSREGGQEMIKAMREGRYLGFMIDQKYNEGIAVPFFGRPAMTNPVFVSLARKFDYPLLPAQIERLGGAHFKITIYPPLEMQDRSTEDVVSQAHRHLEDWIRKRPEQWLWLHRRWDSRQLEETKEAA